jgi:biopolymer transport protein ExbD
LGLAGLISRGVKLAVAAALIAGVARGDDKPAEPLTVIVEDGDVMFQGASLDLDQLTAELTATGRQRERVYFRMGPNAKTSYTRRVVEAIRAAGFSDIAVMPPLGLGKKDPESPL